MSQLKSIPNYPDYLIDSNGTIFSFRQKTPKAMRPYLTKLGYLRVKIANDNGIKRFMAHRLVAMTWLSKPLNSNEINHLDGIKTNNKPSNLEWVTASQNMQHAVAMGLHKAKRGSEHGKAKLTEIQVIKIKTELKNINPKLLRDLGCKYGVCSGAIYQIWKGKNWKHVNV